MHITKPLFCFLTSAVVIAVPTLAHAQSDVSRRTELQTVTLTPIQAGATSMRDSPVGEVGIRSMGVQGSPGFGTGAPGSKTVTNEVEIITFGYQIPDFDPEDLYTHQYRFGMFHDNGNGAGTVDVDTNGYIEYEISLGPEQGEVQTYIYSAHVETGEAKVFIDLDDLTVNKAVGILTGVSRNSRMNAVRFRQIGTGFPPRPSFRMPPEIGNQRWMGLHGEYLTLDDIQEEIFRQTRCNVEEEDGGYYLESCQ